MADASDDRVEVLFHQAVERPPERRAAFLDSACNGDVALRAEVESLLAFDEQTPATMQGRQWRPAGAEALREDPLLEGGTPVAHDCNGRHGGLPPRIGRYRIVRRLGEGGMGIVYEAEQDKPRRPVALKVIRPGLVLPDDLERFDRESQILGRLHHEGIAEIYEASVDDDGRPFFAMELVRGTRLDEYARSHLPDWRERLRLFARVCDAVQHAHDSGIVHRDLKPGNILVDAAGRPKVLDFGVARAQGADWQSAGGRTLTGQLIGTPQYMSPEQIAEDPRAVDGRTDVYSLGLILFELLADQRPYQVEGVPLPEVVRVIREHEPAQLGSINKNYRGDAETIVAKAIDKERTRRYASAGELAADIRRLLAGEPILARRISSLARLGRWARRNRALATALAGLAAVLIGVTIAALVAAGRFRAMANEQTLLATSEAAQRRMAHEAEEATRANLYAAEMNLAARVAELPKGLARLRELVSHWENPGNGRADPRGWEWRLFRDLSKPERLVRTGRDFYAVAWSPDGARLAVTVDETIELLDVAEGTPIAQIRLDGGNAHYVQWSADGSRLAVGMDGGRLAVHDATNGQLLYQAVHGSMPPCICLHPGGNLLASHSDDKVVRIHDLEASKVVAKLPGAIGEVPSAFGFSPNGRRLATAVDADARGFAVGMWDTTEWTLVSKVAALPEQFTSIGWANDRRIVLAMSEGGMIAWDVETDSQAWQHPGEGHLMSAQAASVNGKRVAAGDWGRLVWVWDAESGEQVAIGRGHTEAIYRVAIAPDGARVAAVGRDWNASALRVWDLADPRSVRTLEPPSRGEVPLIAGLAWRPDGCQVAGAIGGSQTGVYDLGAKAMAVRDGCQFVWDRTGGRAVAQRGDEVLVYDADRDDPVRNLSLPGQIKSFAWNPVDDRLAIRVGLHLWLYDATEYDAAESDSLIQLYEESSWQARSAYVPCGGVAWHPDGRVVALASQGPDAWSVRIIDPVTRTTASKFDAMPLTIWAVKWSPDARCIAVAGDDPAIKVFDPATGELLQSLRGHTFTVRDLAYSPDGARLASAGLDGNVLLWDTKSGRLLLAFELEAAALGVAWSSDGTKLAALAETGVVKIWDAGGRK